MEDARERLIETTRELLWDRGYVATSPKTIQAHSGVGQGSMYHHFSGKRDLAVAAIERSATVLREKIEQILDAPGSTMDRLRGFLERDRDVLRGCPIGRLTHDPDILADAQLQTLVEQQLEWLQGRIGGVIRDGQKGGDFSTEKDASDLAATIVAVVQGGYILARASGSPEPFHRTVRGLVALLERENLSQSSKSKSGKKGR